MNEGGTPVLFLENGDALNGNEGISSSFICRWWILYKKFP